MAGTRKARGSGTLAAATIAAALPLGSGALAGQVRELAREATPLVLKDGRIAHVAIWAVPFRPGATELDAEVRNELAGLVETLATDCFLTAQAIGHVEPEAAKAGETLAAHRLARARADRIQQAMVERGLQASAIASVWDWQFLVKEPRVTVWVFRLHEGDDCEGKRLDKAAAVATGTPPPGARELPLRSAPTGPPAAEPPKAPAKGSGSGLAEGGPAPARPGATAAASEPPAGSPAAAPPPMPGTTPPPRPAVAARPSQPPAAPSLPGSSAAADEVPLRDLLAAEAESRPTTRSTEAGETTAAASGGGEAGAVPAIRDVAKVAGAKPAAAERAGSEPEGIKAAAAKPEVAKTPAAAKEKEKPATATVPAAPAAPQREALAALDTGRAGGGREAVALVFDVNSSYLPKGAAAELQAFLRSLPAGSSSELELVGAVGGADVKEASGAAGTRYNRWLAERRVGRVADWLRANAGGRPIKVTTSYREDDPSRRVTVRLKVGG